MQDYSIRFDNYAGLEGMEPASIEQANTQMFNSDENSVYVPFDEKGIEKLAASKRGVFWRKDLKTDPNYEVDLKDAEEVLLKLSKAGVPLILVD